MKKDKRFKIFLLGTKNEFIQLKQVKRNLYNLEFTSAVFKKKMYSTQLLYILNNKVIIVDTCQRIFRPNDILKVEWDTTSLHLKGAY